jgi:DNA-binding transcriptional LysR family regulator
VADMGPCKRPGFTGEGTETLAYRKAVLAIRDQASARISDTGVCRLRIAVPFDRSAAGAALLMVRFDDRHPRISQQKR